jgi:cobalt-zinc-cadmium efflux system protein
MQSSAEQEPKQEHDSLSEIHEYRGVARSRLVLSMIVTSSVMVLEIVGSILSGSLSLGSDAGHMFTHLFALIISYTAMVISCKPPCHHRTYGFYRAEILAALFNSLFLFGVTAYILYEGIIRLLNPQPVLGFEMLLVALAGLAANGVSILLLRSSAKNNINVKGAFLHMFADTASSVAIIIGAIIVSFTDWYIVDPLVGIGISVIIFVWAYGLFKESVNILLETAPKGLNVDLITTDLQANVPEIIQITDMHIWQITTDMYTFTAHIQSNITDAQQSEQMLDKINQRLKDRFNINYTTIQLKYQYQAAQNEQAQTRNT